MIVTTVACVVVSSAASAGPILAITAPNGPPADFGSVVVGQGASLGFEVTNTGNATLHFTSALTVTGANAGDFSVTSANPPADLAPSDATTFTIAFQPTGTGTRTASVTVSTNDSVNSPQTIALTGTGDSNASIDVTPSTFDDGTVTSGSSKDTRLRSATRERRAVCK